MVKFDLFFKLLTEHNVKYVVVGGLAASAQGSSYLTEDIDICYARDKENLLRLAEALQLLHPALRGAPAGLPFRLDFSTLRAGLNFTLTTDYGDIDLLGEVAGLGMYDEVVKFSEELEVFGVTCRVLTLEGLIVAKRVAGRAKDLRVLPELEALLELRRSRKE